MAEVKDPAAVAWVQYPAEELLYAEHAAKKKKSQEIAVVSISWHFLHLCIFLAFVTCGHQHFRIFFFFCRNSHVQASNLHHSSNPNCCRDNTGPLTAAPQENSPFPVNLNLIYGLAIFLPVQRVYCVFVLGDQYKNIEVIFNKIKN